MARPQNLALLLTHCGQLIARKISKFDATRYQILRLKCTKFDFGWGYSPDPAGEAYSANRNPVFKGAYFYRDGRGKRGEEKGREDEGGKGGKGPGPQLFWPRTAPAHWGSDCPAHHSI